MRLVVVLLVASRIPAPGALPLNLAGAVSSEVGPLRVPEVVGTMVEFSTMVLSGPFVLFVSSAWRGSGVSDTMEDWQTPEMLPNSE